MLYLEGIPRWDFRFLDHSLRRDKGLAVDFVMESQLLADGVKPDRLPTAAHLPTEVDKWADYHAVILGDISPALLPAEAQRMLVQAVQEKGLGLIIQCGSRHMPWDYLDGPLAEVLPMKFDRRSTRPDTDNPLAAVGGVDAPAFAPFRMSITPEGATHPAFTLYGNATADRRAWGEMPEFFWAAVGSQLKPGAERLAEIELPSKEKRPLIAEQLAGRGRVLIVGCDETFRWRRNIGDQLFYRFWGQALRHVARKESATGHESWLDAQPQRVEPGSPVSVELFAVNAEGTPLDRQTVTVTVGKDQDREPLKLERAGEAGHFRGTWTTPEPGMYGLEYTAPSQPPIRAQVQVSDSGRERAHPAVDRDTLGALADISGGELLELGKFDQLAEHLHGAATSEVRPYEDDLWDNWLTLVLLVGLYCTDVGIRRVLGLI